MEDFQKAFGYALTVLYTFKALKDEEKCMEYMEYFSTAVFNKIQLLVKYHSDEIDWTKRVNKLIRCISDFNNELPFSDEVLNVSK